MNSRSMFTANAWTPRTAAMGLRPARMGTMISRFPTVWLGQDLPPVSEGT